jgi:hypothetical protein
VAEHQPRFVKNDRVELAFQVFLDASEQVEQNRQADFIA